MVDNQRRWNFTNKKKNVEDEEGNKLDAHDVVIVAKMQIENMSCGPKVTSIYKKTVKWRIED